MANDANNSMMAVVPYDLEINEYLLNVIHSNERIEVLGNIERNARKRAEDLKNLCFIIKDNKTLLETQLKRTKQNKESLLAALEAYKSTNLVLKNRSLLAKEQNAYILEQRIKTLKIYEEKWLTTKNLFENIPFIKSFIEKNYEIETVKRGIDSINNEVEKMRSDIILKKTEFLNMRNKNIVELADYMINKKPLILKSINEATNAIKNLKNEKQINNPVMKNKLPASGLNKLTIKAKKISTEDTVSASRNSKPRNAFALPQLRLTAHSYAAPINFDQKVNCSARHDTGIAKKRPFESFITRKFHALKKENIAEKIDEVNVSTYLFAAPKTMDRNNIRKYPNDKLIRVLENVKLDTTGTYKIVSQLKPDHLQDVNVIKATESQHDLNTDPPQENVNENIITEDIEILDLTKKASQDVILPPTQFLDFTLSPQEKRVTFNGVITIEELQSLVTNDTTPQDDNAINDPPGSQLNASTTSNDSFKKIKDFVFKKRNVNLSPEFTYTRNVVVPMVAENKTVTSKFFDEKQQGDNNIDSSQIQNMEIVEVVDEEPQLKQTQEIHAETINQTNTTSDNTFEAQECTQKDEVSLAAPSFSNSIRDIPRTLNISMNKTGNEDDGEFPHCIDSSLLLSPKADDEMQTNNNKIETQPREVPSFLSGFRRTGFSLFGTKTNEADAQNQNNFNFNFGGNEKTKKSGFFNMFQ
ncbi:uncharacterized protein LOC123872739 [Maniola jurtina]|uniref:uncharacterized protein LOC123872739 n=1 Tax=Maniola jurtina TaxID=191418 RepID=UPI001E688E3C|nr:uncharacterized protein LOC123872739 [Maniola jurtina]